MMKSSNDITFAFVGRPNVGKSSIVSTLILSGEIDVSNEPGKTQSISQYSIKHNEYVVCKLVDTPGIENSEEIYKSLKENSFNLDGIQDYIDKYKNKKGVGESTDTRILEALNNTTHIVYVVDSSTEYKKDRNFKELKVIESFQKPIYIIFNRINLKKDYRQKWKEGLEKDYNLNIQKYIDFNPLKGCCGNSTRLFRELVSELKNEENLMEIYNKFIKEKTNKWSKIIVDTLYDIYRVEPISIDKTNSFFMGTLNMNIKDTTETWHKKCVKKYEKERDKKIKQCKIELKKSFGFYGKDNDGKNVAVEIRENPNIKDFPAIVATTKEDMLLRMITVLAAMGLGIIVGFISDNPIAGILTVPMVYFIAIHAFKNSFNKVSIICKFKENEPDYSLIFLDNMIMFINTMIDNGYAKRFPINISYAEESKLNIDSKDITDIHRNFVKGFDQRIEKEKLMKIIQVNLMEKIQLK